MTEPRKFHHWVHLNEKGKELFGSVFPDGIVPVQMMFSQNATLQGQDGIQRVYKVDWEQLSNEQQESIVKILSRTFGAQEELIRHQFESDGFIPLRDLYVSGGGTDQMGLFL